MKKRSASGLLLLFLPLLQVLAQPQTFQPRGVGGGGALFFPTINPANDNEFFIACDMSQMYHSTDFGASYNQLHFRKLAVGSRSTWEFTNNAQIAWSLYNDGNITYPVRTTDGGNTWNTLPGNPDPGSSWDAIRANYHDPDMMFMHNWNTLYITRDGGTTFSSVKQANDNNAGIFIAGIFVDGNNIFIGTNDGIVYSTNSGTSFSVLSTTGMPATEGIFSFAGAKSGNTTRFFCVSALKADLYNGIMPWEYWGLAAGVYSLDYGINTWTPKNTGITTNDHVMYVGMAWDDISIAYLGGSNGNTSAPEILKTTNAGTSWTNMFQDQNNQNITTGWSGYQGDRQWSYGETAFGISVAPHNANKVIFGDFGFVHKTTDGGATWSQAYVSAADQHASGAPTPMHQSYHSIGIENTTCWQIHWTNANSMFSCFSDIKGCRSTDAGTTWSFNYTGHDANSMYRIVQHPTTGTLFAATSNIHDMYQSTRLADAQLDANDSQGKIIYSTDNGVTWNLLHAFNHPVFWLALDPTNPDKMYASVIHYGGGSGQGGVWHTSDLGNLAASSWAHLSNPPRTEGHPASLIVLNDGKLACTFSGRRNASGVFTASSGCFLYDPTSSAWTDVSDPGMHYWTKDIILDPADTTQSTWYVCVFSGWGGAPNGLGGLYRTTNRGNSWIKLTGSHFDRVTSITFNPADSNEIYLTTENDGLWISQNIRSASPAFTRVDAYPFRQPERVFFNPNNNEEIWVTSFGNGMKMGSLTATGMRFDDPPSAMHFTLFPNPATDHIILHTDPAVFGPVLLCDMQGRIPREWVVSQQQTRIDISGLPPGPYLIRAGSETRKLMKH